MHDYGLPSMQQDATVAKRFCKSFWYRTSKDLVLCRTYHSLLLQTLVVLKSCVRMIGMLCKNLVGIDGNSGYNFIIRAIRESECRECRVITCLSDA